jgi:excisionase family DNA binding protein
MARISEGLTDFENEVENVEGLFSVERAAQVLGISPWTVRRYIASNRISAVRIGRRVLLEQQELQRIIEDGRAQADMPPATEAGQ